MSDALETLRGAAVYLPSPLHRDAQRALDQGLARPRPRRLSRRDGSRVSDALESARGSGPVDLPSPPSPHDLDAQRALDQGLARPRPRRLSRRDGSRVSDALESARGSGPVDPPSPHDLDAPRDRAVCFPAREGSSMGDALESCAARTRPRRSTSTCRAAAVGVPALGGL